MTLASLTSSPATRRGVLRGGALAGVATLGVVGLRSVASPEAALAATTGCTTLTKQVTQGPFWVDERLERSDLRVDSYSSTLQAGVPLTLTMYLTDATGACTPQAGAYVDLWHANAQGAYSDVSGSGNPAYTDKNDWLRGYQVSDVDGKVTFTTIFPGWYVSRAVHIHFRVRTTLSDSSTVNFTSQLFFDESITQAVLKTSAYKADSSQRTTNTKDSIYESSFLVPLTGDTTSGYTGSYTVNLDFGDGAATTTSTPAATPTASATATASTSATPSASATASSATASATTSTPSTTASSTAAPSATATAASAPDTLVDAAVVSAAVVLRRGRRVVQVVTTSGETTTARVRLLRHDDLLAVRRFGWLGARRRRRLSVNVPRGVSAGPAKVMVVLADRAGNTRTEKVAVTVPAR